MRRKIGSVKELGKNHYKVTISAGINPKTGRPAKKSKNVRGSLVDAERALIALAVSVGKGDEIKEDMTLDAYWTVIYLPNAEGRLRPRTIAGYKDNYKSMIRDYLGGLKMSQITPPVVDRWLTNFQSNRRKYDAFRMLRIIIRRAKRDKIISVNPIENYEAPKYRKYKPQVLSSKDASAYIKAAYGAEIEPVVLIMLGAGLRIEELTPMTWGDISHDGDVTILKATTYYNTQEFSDGTKTEFADRVVRLPKGVIKRLNEIREDNSLNIMHWPNGKPMTYINIYRRYKNWLKTLPSDVRRIPWKDLRHTSLTLTLEGGSELLTVSRRAGHASIGITAAYYLRPDKSVDEAAAEGLDNLLG